MLVMHCANTDRTAPMFVEDRTGCDLNTIESRGMIAIDRVVRSVKCRIELRNSPARYRREVADKVDPARNPTEIVIMCDVKVIRPRLLIPKIRIRTVLI